MKKRMRVLMAGICLLAGLGISTEYAGAERKSAPSISAEAGCVIDVQSGAVLYDKNMNKREYYENHDDLGGTGKLFSVRRG